MPANKTWIMGSAQFEARMPHHDGIRALWETKWKGPCQQSVYPFHDGDIKDFEPIFTSLIQRDINDCTSTEYTRAFFPTAEKLKQQGDILSGCGDKVRASSVYLRAACLLRIARFPYITGFPEPNCPAKWEAWQMQKSVYLKAAEAWAVPINEFNIHHIRAKGRDRCNIPVYVRVPSDASVKARPLYPVVVLLTGLDGYRTDNTARLEEFTNRGWASIVVEIPGTADCPADPADPASIERLWDSVMYWVSEDARLDPKRIMVWGLSSGGYYAVRLAHTRPMHMIGAVAQGAGCHHWFDSEWLDKADGHEYPFPLLPALATKYGFDSVEKFKSEAQAKFSLLETGILKQPSARLLLINGMQDGLMPIEDSMMLFEYGSPKEGRFFPGALHMGYPQANASVYPWMEAVMDSIKDD